ncbi:Methylmalonyl-CoA mutase, large subunit [Nitrospina gracilis 3/211]|uniref:Methylmalonyl-CoA mutase, large subunit n=1 Tax=Nitrospina gracilis (strain 3/211) TaxID=1266370 RepID=M1YIW8_NITG3|nr:MULTISPECIES: methylmalonyl-CoA mutase family protein [Nitrospina]MCF8723390.1 methylmalonyl-CoA mutase cobalamin-binding domain/chain [Nitrospina sp. Nb-3]CCQ90448.1 Methylmalonyl-CoA mutase, large subunit [Nitrospina gracilis 3/211]
MNDSFLEKIISANKRYQERVEDSVHCAKSDPEYQQELLKLWNDKAGRVQNHVLPNGTSIPLIALPEIDHPVQVARYQGEWGFPGEFPFGLSIYPQAFLIVEGKRGHEEPTRLFAGLGSPEMTNERFHYIVSGQQSKRLSTAFDTNTLLGRGSDDPDYFYDIGEGGVSVCTYEDVKTLYQGFLKEDVSISMTINGPSLWVTAARLKAAQEAGLDLKQVRGTSQTDPCKEDDAQNELLFPLDKSICLAMDMFEWCLENAPMYYPINVSGYHIEQKGATPIQQAAFTLANGFVYVEEALKRGLDINHVGRRLPFFFTSGTDFEYIALLSAARRFWAVAMRDVYGAKDPSAQKLKAHIQTSGRSLHEREYLNNITRTALELFYALLNYPQALHSNSYDEPFTIPTEKSVRIASDAQAILLEEMGGFKDMMGFLSDSSGRYQAYRTVLGGILDYFRQINDLGGVLEAKAEGFFRDEISRSSARYEEQLESGRRRIVAVNCYPRSEEERPNVERTEISNALKRERAQKVKRFKKNRNPLHVRESLRRLKETASKGGNVFAVTLDTVKEVTLDEWTRALQEVYGLYRRKL